MTLRLQIIMTITFTVVFLLILNTVRKRRLELKYSLPWFILIIILIIIFWIPGGLAKFSSFLGIYSPVNMIFMFGFIFSLVLLFILTITVSRMSVRIRRLAQMIAIENEMDYQQSKSEELDGEKNKINV